MAARTTVELLPFPPLTRMLLTSDGSTTLLLEALLGVPLRVRVRSHVAIGPHEIDPQLAARLRVRDEERLILRRSQLVRPDGIEVSHNRVIFRAGPTLWSGDDADPTPLGTQLRIGGALLRRETLATGLDHWPAEPRSRCAYKEYVIYGNGDDPIYVHERFNPYVIPPA